MLIFRNSEWHLCQAKGRNHMATAYIGLLFLKGWGGMQFEMSCGVLATPCHQNVIAGWKVNDFLLEDRGGVRRKSAGVVNKQGVEGRWKC